MITNHHKCNFGTLSAIFSDIMAEKGKGEKYGTQPQVLPLSIICLGPLPCPLLPKTKPLLIGAIIVLDNPSFVPLGLS